MPPVTGIYRFQRNQKRVAQKCFGIDERMFRKEILPCREQRFGIHKAFVLVRGAPDLFSTMISGWDFRKSLL